MVRGVHLSRIIRNFRLKVAFAKFSPKLAVFFVVCAVVVYNEVFSFVFSSLQWPNLYRVSQEDDLRILFVADPQLQGLRDELPLLGVITRWDADKYLQFGFFHAVGHVRPDVVVFLGDLLDEGSIASEDEYKTYIHRFRKVFKMPAIVKSIFISGDNDVGGEGIDSKLQWKVERFSKQFEAEQPKAVNQNMVVSNIKHASFQKISIDYGEQISESHTEMLANVRKQSTARYRITCNHMPLLNRLPLQVLQVVEILQPHLLITAHTHVFRVYRCKDCRSPKPAPDVKKQWSPVKGQAVDVRNLPRPLSFNLSDVSQLFELIVPTCSYRMGVPNMGYGAAVISKNGQMKFDVLWLPSRYHQLAVYVAIILLVALWFLIVNLYKGYYMLIDMN